jgi:hypothetical protein
MNINASLHTGLVLAGFDQQARRSGSLSTSLAHSKADLGRPSLVQPGLLGSGLLPFFGSYLVFANLLACCLI